jgi:hypothetical protein
VEKGSGTSEPFFMSGSEGSIVEYGHEASS